MATTRAQYGGLKFVVLSTRMKRRGCEDIVGSNRFRWSRLTFVASVEFGGMKIPSLRKDFMLDMRRREDALGERRMMGSRRRFFWRLETRGVVPGSVFATVGGMGAFGCRVRTNVFATVRYMEKSYIVQC